MFSRCFFTKTRRKGDNNTSISVDSKNPTGLVRFYFAEVFDTLRSSAVKKGANLRRLGAAVAALCILRCVGAVYKVVRVDNYFHSGCGARIESP